jgi:hypothetical protein
MDYERRNKRPESGELFVIMVYSLLVAVFFRNLILIMNLKK